MFRIIPGACILLASLHCSAELRVSSPVEACALLTDSKLRAGKWSQDQNGAEGCQSTERPVNTNNSSVIYFAVEGTDNRPTQVRLVVDVYSSDDEDPAKRQLIKATKRLAVRALGLSVPFPVEESIMKGRPLKLPLGTGTLTITRTSSIKGRYQISVMME